MKALYIDCGMGAAGDMLGAALLEIYGDRSGFIEMMNRIGIEGVNFEARDCVRCGIRGTKLHVSVHGIEEAVDGGTHTHAHSCSHGHTHSHADLHGHIHSHTSFREVLARIDSLDIPEQVKKDAAAVYGIIGEAEAKAHGKEIEDIHFHEVGTLDAVADVVCVCMLMRLIAPEKVICSPVCTGSGTVSCAHGILSVPVPAVTEILKGVPIYAGDISSELCTPTGAALLKYFADEFKTMPVMRVECTGTGMGTKEFERMNGVRAFLGETEDRSGDRVCVIRCNIDDMTGEDIGYATEKLMSGGALDVFTVPVYMKKNRPGVLLVCICGIDEREKFVRLIFKHTTTRGLRYSQSERKKLVSVFGECDTIYGKVRIKKSTGFGAERIKPEFEDIRRIADENGISAAEVRRDVCRDLRFLQGKRD